MTCFALNFHLVLDNHHYYIIEYEDYTIFFVVSSHARWLESASSVGNFREFGMFFFLDFNDTVHSVDVCIYIAYMQYVHCAQCTNINGVPNADLYLFYCIRTSYRVENAFVAGFGPHSNTHAHMTIDELYICSKRKIILNCFVLLLAYRHT